MSTQGERFRLLVGSTEFWESLKADIAAAQERVWMVTLSLEGDAAGLPLAEALIGSGAPDRRVMVDEFTRWVQNDRFLYSRQAMADRELQAEVRATEEMLRRLSRAGVSVRWVSPLGFLGRKAAWRNHKKLLIIDGEICYLGGINFTEHNFQWHDMMVRIEDPEATAFLAADMERGWKGEGASEVCELDGLELLTIDPPDLSPYDRVWELLEEAQEEIFVQSAYVTLPLSDQLGAAARRGVKVRILSPDSNNVPLFMDYIIWEAGRHGFELNLLPGMTHMKAIMVDGRALVLGSANLHFTGHWTQGEVLGIVTDPGLVAEFTHRIIKPDWERSRPFEGSSKKSRALLRFGMKAYGRVLGFVGRGRPIPPRIAP